MSSSEVASTAWRDLPTSATTAGMIVQGAWRFAIVGTAAFSVWAFGGRWFHAHTGDAGLYASTTAVFIALSGPLLHPLLAGGGAARFYGIFLPAFLAYASVWSLSWFLFGLGAGEWLGSAAGSAAFVAFSGWRLGNLRPFFKAVLVFFVLHSCGYFLGGMLTDFLGPGGAGAGLLADLGRTGAGAIARLSWGVVFGIGFGAGMGYTFHVFQKETTLK